MDSDSESERLFSLRLSRVMGDIGVNSWMIARRRKRYLKEETMNNVYYKLSGINCTNYIFGSQSEATTTSGMKSDTDYLYCDNAQHVALHLRDWQYGKPNLLVLKNELTPPQHCYLQRLREDCPLPAVQAEDPDDVMDIEGKIILTNTRVEIQDSIRQDSESGEIFIHGPSMTDDEKFDYIHAFHCRQLPEECQFMFHRPRPGHWPRPDILGRARDAGVFLVPQGYSESPTEQSMCRSTAFMVPSKLTNYPHTKWQWRFSTSLMERLLMFDLSPIQVKTYTLVKIIRKTLFKPVFGDRFSTFHIKTAMMFTIENCPPEIWREDNIIKCVCLLLETLQRWLNQKCCPHFTISSVNLFVGKLHIWELPKLCNIISHLINTKLQCLFNTRMDNIGLRLQQCSGREDVSYQNVRKRRRKTMGSVLEQQLFQEIYRLIQCMDTLIIDESVDDVKNYLFNLQSKLDNPSDLEQEVVNMYTPFLCGTIAFMQASKCISLGQPITPDIFNWYHLSLDSDLMSSRLKFASMLYCTRQYEEAAEVLTYCKGLLRPELWQCCASHNGRKCLEESAEYSNKVFSLSNIAIVKKYTMVCISFTKKEINCIPQHLQFEMKRGMAAKYTREGDTWKNNVVTDCKPFLYYLQHLTYSELNQPMIAQTALHHLHEYTMDSVESHIDTAYNMLGHCYELQNRLDLALMCYKRSLNTYGRDNVSIWHLARILHQFS